MVARLDDRGAPYAALLDRRAGTGHRDRIVAGDGPARLAVAEHGIAWEPLDWSGSRLSSLRHLRALVDPGEPVLIVAGPDTAHVLASAAAVGPTLCVLPDGPDELDRTLGPAAVSRLLDLIGDLQRADRLRTLAVGDDHRTAYERRLGVPVVPFPALDDDTDPGTLDAAAAVIADTLTTFRRLPDRPDLSSAAEVAAALQDDRDEGQRAADEIWQTRMSLQAELDALG
ncbi:MAG: hypothetical protein ITG02_07970 [Patulibacter sp.]|nr:hypothetical protein [Patulibacter sp.]